MANIVDYLDWRGDIPFSVSPFNEIDGLILAEFGYMPLEGIVPHGFSLRVSMKNALEQYNAATVEEKRKILTFDNDNALFQKLAGSVRFGGTQITGYVTHMDEETQFSALTCFLDDGTTFVALRGTDNSLVGWKEDMNLSYMQETGGQNIAKTYLNTHFRNHPRPIRLGGHSKGGNLAVYAAAFCEPEIRPHIVSVQTYDAPGFREEIVDSPEYRAVLPKIASYIPESSVVGLLLNNPAEHTIVKSTASGIMQHLAFSWEVLRDHFVEAEELSRSGNLLNKAVTNWISQFEDEERRQIIESVFGVLEASEADTFREIQQSKWKSYPAMLRAVHNLSPEQQKLLKNALIGIAKSGADAMRGEEPDKSTAKPKPAEA